MNTGMTSLDWAIIVAYLVGVVGIGAIADASESAFPPKSGQTVACGNS
jgi:hypothetical protein